MINKIGIVGGGNIGGVLAAEIVSRRLARNVALVDVKGPDLAAGKCLDIAEATPVYGSDVNIVGAKTYDILDRLRFRDQHRRRAARDAPGRHLPLA
jgi:malate/lactate dehydrogenase